MILGTVNVAAGVVVVNVRLPFPVGFWDSFLGFLGRLFEGYISVRCRCYNHWPVGRLVPRPRPGPGQFGCDE